MKISFSLVLLLTFMLLGCTDSGSEDERETIAAYPPQLYLQPGETDEVTLVPSKKFSDYSSEFPQYVNDIDYSFTDCAVQDISCKKMQVTAQSVSSPFHTKITGIKGEAFTYSGEKSYLAYKQYNVNIVDHAEAVAAIDIAASAYVNLALLNDGTVWSWAYRDLSTIENTHAWTMGRRALPRTGQYNSKKFEQSTGRFPEPISGLSNIIDIAANCNMAAAVNNTGEVYSWGHYTSGAIQQVSGLPAMRNIYAGDEGSQERFAGIAQDGSIWTWASDLDSVFSTPLWPTIQPTRVLFNGNSSAVKEIVVTRTMLLALMENGSVWIASKYTEAGAPVASINGNSVTAFPIPSLSYGVTDIANVFGTRFAVQDNKVMGWGN